MADVPAEPPVGSGSFPSYQTTQISQDSSLYGALGSDNPLPDQFSDCHAGDFPIPPPYIQAGATAEDLTNITAETPLVPVCSILPVNYSSAHRHLSFVYSSGNAWWRLDGTFERYS